MDTNIRFKIGSEFVGEGFNRANTAVTNLGRAANTGVTAITKVTGALTTVEGTTGKVATGVMGVVSGFRSLGIVGGVAAIAVEGVKLWLGKCAEEAAKLAEKAKEAGVAIREKLAETINGILGPAKENFEKVGAAIDRDEASLNKMAAAANRVAAAMGEAESTAGSARVANLELEKLNNVLKAQNENAAGLASAEGDLKIALENQKNEAEKNTTLVEAAHKAENAASDKVTRATDNLAAAKDNLKQREEDLRLLEWSGCRDTSALNTAKQNLKAAHDLVAKRQDELSVASLDLKTAQINVTSAVNKQRAAVTNNEIAVTSATDAVNKAKDKIAKAEIAEKISADAKEKLAAAEEQRRDLTKKRTASIEFYEAKREAALSNLADAHRRSQEWEEKAAAISGKKYTELQKINLEKLSSTFDKMPKALNDMQKDAVYEYKEWLKYQKENPYKDAIEKAEVRLQAADRDMKNSLRNIDKQTEDLQKVIAEHTKTIADCMKMS